MECFALLGESEKLREEFAPVTTVSDLLNEAPTSRFHRRAVLISGMGFFTDAYDLFVIGTVAAIVTVQWHLSTTETSWVTGSALLGAVVGAFVFGRLADLLGRKCIYILVAAIMIVGAVGSAFSPDFVCLVVARFVLGLGVGGDYPVSAVMMSEFSNRQDRGRLVSMVFSMQALGLIVGPLVGLALLGSGISQALSWRLLLGLGAVPAAAVIYLRSQIPESPRFQAQVQGHGQSAARDAAGFSEGVIDVSNVSVEGTRRMGLREFLSNPRMLLLLVSTAGSWFLFDYAYYGNTLSLPVILKSVDAHASLETKLAFTLALFAVFALPGYAMAVLHMDKIGHKRLQLIGFSVIAVAFLALGAIPQLTSSVVPFLAVFGLSYFFVEFGPNTTTFVLPSEVFPVSMRTTGHGFAAGVGKFGAFIGVFLVPQLQRHIGLRGMLIVAAGAASLVLPEPARRSLEQISGEDGELTLGSDPSSELMSQAS